MKNILLFVLLCLLISVTESGSRRRRQYNGYGYQQQYGSQYGLYGPGGQGYMNMDNRYPNQQGWNNNFNWNQGNRRPEWYYNTSNTLQSSFLYLILLVISILIV